MFPFTIRQIEVFLEICRARNFSAAAERLQVSQPTISNLIKSLETQLGVELFLRRRGASCVLSPEGLVFRENAQLFMAQCEQLWRGMGRRTRKPRPVRIYVGGHLLDDYVRPQLPMFHQEHPQLNLNFLANRSRDQLMQDIRAGRVDVAVISSPPTEETPATLRLGDVEAGIYVRRDLYGDTPRDQVASLPYVMPVSGSSQIETTILRAMTQLGIPSPRIVATSQYHDVAVHMCCEGRGALYSIQSIVDKHDPERVLVRILEDEPWQRRVYIDPRVEAPSATAIVNFLTRVLSLPKKAFDAERKEESQVVRELPRRPRRQVAFARR